VDESSLSRFWAKVDPGITGCWHWAAAKDDKGYGKFWYAGALRMAHRVSYEHFVGPIPEDLELDHVRDRCGHRDCVNPEHLEPVTPLENKQRIHNGDSTRCKHGHEFTDENTAPRKTGGVRRCRACARKYAAQQRENKRPGG
jgi:hypothetical protein